MKASVAHPSASKTAADSTSQGPAMTDNRAAAITQRKMQEAIAGSPRQQARQQQALSSPTPPRRNTTGLPDALKAGVETLSGHSLDDVQVHYNSAKPAQLQAHAYAQGTDIHVAPGQEKHLPHEAWHVVQQKQGRVQPTKQLKGKENINDDEGLEQEADAMGAKAAQVKVRPADNLEAAQATPEQLSRITSPTAQLELKDPNDAAQEAILIQAYKAAETAGDAIAKSMESTPQEQTRAMQYYQTAAAKREQVNNMHDVVDAGHRQAVIDLGTKIEERQTLITAIKDKEKAKENMRRQKEALAARDAAKPGGKAKRAEAVAAPYPEAQAAALADGKSKEAAASAGGLPSWLGGAPAW